MVALKLTSHPLSYIIQCESMKQSLAKILLFVEQELVISALYSEFVLLSRFYIN